MMEESKMEKGSSIIREEKVRTSEHEMFEQKNGLTKDSQYFFMELIKQCEDGEGVFAQMKIIASLPESMLFKMVTIILEQHAVIRKAILNMAASALISSAESLVMGVMPDIIGTGAAHVENEEPSGKGVFEQKRNLNDKNSGLSSNP
jgi:hypothetical protein